MQSIQYKKIISLTCYFQKRAHLAGLVALIAGFTPVDAADVNIEHRTVAVEHIEIHSAKGFDVVASRLETAVPVLDPAIFAALSSGDQEHVDRLLGDTPLFIFLKREHGALLKIAGQQRKAMQYEIGNPLTATKMTRYRLGASLYAPLRVTLYENEAGGSTFAYDQPSNLFGQFGDEQVAAVARGLDEKLKAALLRAAE
jgi:uncharacterized protein (DUF302 family)